MNAAMIKPGTLKAQSSDFKKIPNKLKWLLNITVESSKTNSFQL